MHVTNIIQQLDKASYATDLSGSLYFFIFKRSKSPSSSISFRACEKVARVIHTTCNLTRISMWSQNGMIELLVIHLLSHSRLLIVVEHSIVATNKAT